jgi:hypothetical protein
VPVEQGAVDGGIAETLISVPSVTARLIAAMTRCRRRAEPARRPSVMAVADALVLVMRCARKWRGGVAGGCGACRD